MLKESKITSAILLGCAGCAILMACFLVVGVAVLGLGLYSAQRSVDSIATAGATIAGIPSPTPPLAKSNSDTPPLTPTPFATNGATAEPSPAMPTPIAPLPNIPDHISQQPIPPAAYANLQRLKEADYPIHDYFESAKRLDSTHPGSRTVPATQYALNDIQRFVTDTGEVDARLAAIGDNVYMWVDVDLDLADKEIVVAMTKFEQDYYPQLSRLFGSVWQPGMDNDPRFSILHLAQFNNDTEIGYFDSGDEYPISINNESNQQEIIYLNMSELELGEEVYFGTLIHEAQHLIQWHMDGNETTWLDEGLAQLAETILELDSVDTYHDWLDDPQIQLNRWDYEDDDAVYAHYGGAYLLTLYLWEQLGDQAIADLARHPANGLMAVEAILAKYKPDTTLDQFLGDWAAANWLDGETSEKAYHIKSLRLSEPDSVQTLNRRSATFADQILPFGVHYIELRHKGESTISFAGNTLANLIAAPPPSGELMWLAPSADNLSASLTASFDLTQLDSATLTFKAWYDLEEEWDFAYVAISEDNGDSWNLLRPDHSVAGQYGPAFNGRSSDNNDAEDEWVTESISLNRYAGKEIMIRFETLTDSAIRNGGFAIDDIAIPQLGYANDTEGETGEWRSEGFVRTGWQIPQSWVALYVDETNVGIVQPIPLNVLNQGQLQVELAREGGVLIVMPTAPFAQNPADYWVSVESQ